MERVYKAKNEIRLNLANEDGFIIEEDGFTVPKDSVWYWDDNDEEEISSTIELLSEDLKQWIEIEIAVLELEFEEITLKCLREAIGLEACKRYDNLNRLNKN